ncbi:hypothetical protein EDB19DRAFT_1957237 [Suillus lakei]|nr:hypothetical protein EDB19DRAFT_1957237 [Suillus lakei]
MTKEIAAAHALDISVSHVKGYLGNGGRACAAIARGFSDVSSLMDYMLGIMSSPRAKKLTKPLLRNIFDILGVHAVSAHARRSAMVLVALIFYMICFWDLNACLASGLITPDRWYSELRQGTLVLFAATMHGYVQKEPGQKPRKTWQLVAKSIKVIDCSDEIIEPCYQTVLPTAEKRGTGPSAAHVQAGP